MTDVTLDVFGQQLGLSNLYTQICFCFQIPDDHIQLSAITSTLTSGLKRMSTAFPWVAGQVIKDDSTGLFKVVALDDIPRLVVKDLRSDNTVPSMGLLRQSQFPMRMLDENIIAPKNTLSTGTSDQDSPVFLVQATFIKEGLLITFVAQHNVMDMTGQGRVINLLDKACHGHHYTQDEVTSGNVDRTTIIPFLDESYDVGPELNHQKIKPRPSSETKLTDSKEPTSSSWAYFIFSSDSLAALKSIASASLESGYISTDDTMSAFIWQSIIRVRLRRLDPTRTVTFARAIDPRRYLDVPATYPGMVQNMTYHTYSAQDLVKTPLGEIAAQLRTAVDPMSSSLPFQTRALATALHRSLTKDDFSVTATLDLSADLMLSSWAKETFHNLDFHLGLGKPEAVRRPQFTPVESLLYLMPKALNGDIAAALCLRDEDMDFLKDDYEFCKYATYVG